MCGRLVPTNICWCQNLKNLEEAKKIQKKAPESGQNGTGTLINLK